MISAISMNSRSRIFLTKFGGRKEPLLCNPGLGLLVTRKGILVPVFGPSSVEDATDVSRLSPCGTPPPGENLGSVAGRLG